jgi:hypothetical protein
MAPYHMDSNWIIYVEPLPAYGLHILSQSPTVKIFGVGRALELRRRYSVRSFGSATLDCRIGRLRRKSA